MKPTLTKYQDRYDAIEKSVLENEWKYFVCNCEKEGFRIDKSLTLETFIVQADKCDYKLGMKPKHEEANGRIVYPFTVSFYNRPTIKIPFGTKPLADRSKGRNKFVEITNLQDIPGFGIKLNLLGWSKFCNINTRQLTELLNMGMTIEDIFNPHVHGVGKGKTRTVVLDGRVMSTSEACSEVGINASFFSMMARKAKSSQEYQECFDKAVENVNKAKEKGFITKYSRSWIIANDTDVETICCHCRKNGISVADFVHEAVTKLIV